MIEKKCPYEGLIVPTALHVSKACVMRSVERRKVNGMLFEMKCLRSLLGVSRMDRFYFRNEEVRKRAGIERVLKWFGTLDTWRE